VLDGDVVRVLWPRYEGELPGALYTAVPGTLVLSAVRTDGVLDSVLASVPVPR